MRDQSSEARPVLSVTPGMPASDGAGVRLHRLIGTPRLDAVDPFLMLDEFRSDNPSDYIAGFPSHPHRGFETVTYMLAGRMRHEDNKGNKGLLRAGSVQWMTAGRGIVHSEMPEQENGLMWGFQLWVNLPAKDKMIAPRYQDIQPEDIPETTLPGGAKVRVVAGRFGEVKGTVEGIVTEPLLLDVTLPAGATVAVPVTRGHNAFAYPFEGKVAIGDPAKLVARGDLAVLGEGDAITLAAGDGPARVLLAAARPLNETVARYGPFVMNSREQLIQAVEDYNAGKF